jgi:hypothetical protein
MGKINAEGGLEAKPTGLIEFFDAEKLRRKYAADPMLSSLAHMSAQDVVQALVHYRHFTHYYIADLALLVSKMPFGRLRSVLADFLNDELGNRNPDRSHAELYDQFLLSLGATPDLLKTKDSWICEPLTEVSQQVATLSWLHGVGLRGLGGECLCQVYLESVYGFLQANPSLNLQSARLDFWEIHAGQVDQEHRTTTLETLDELFLHTPGSESIIRASYLNADRSWNLFWSRAFQSVLDKKTAHGSDDREASERSDQPDVA